METLPATNEEQAHYHNGGGNPPRLVREERNERMLSPFTDHLLTAAAIRRADRVVDIGCGTGSTTRVAGRVAIDGQALGMDRPQRCCAKRPDTPRGGIDQCRFELGDAQLHHHFTPGAGDVTSNRFGVTSFADPAAAFAGYLPIDEIGACDAQPPRFGS
jgi:SAM-dependent methyltransferase